MRGFRKIWALSLFLSLLVSGNLAAEEPDKYPSRPVTLTGAFAAGGSTDLTCRAIASVAPKYFSQPIISVPKPGGAGLVALQNLASSRPDGYTYHLGRPSEMSIAPFIEKMPFDMEKDFIPVGQVAQDRIAFSVSSKLPWKNIEELIAAARKEPEKIKFACSSSTATTRLGLEKFCHEAGIKLACVPFKGGTPAAIAVAGGHVQVLTSTVSEALPHTQRGDMRALLICADQRVKEYPDVPTSKEKGFDVNFGIWCTVFARKETPPAILAKFEEFLKKSAEDKEFVAAMTKLGSEPGFVSAGEFAGHWAKERKWIGDIVRQVGLAKNP
jgi:tripartite-type tricarboxylate transporter receptor subunit TctC